MSIEIKTPFDVNHMFMEICGAWQGGIWDKRPSDVYAAGMLLGMALVLEQPDYSKRVWDLYFSEPDDDAIRDGLRRIVADIVQTFRIEGVHVKANG